VTPSVPNASTPDSKTLGVNTLSLQTFTLASIPPWHGAVLPIDNDTAEAKKEGGSPRNAQR
jgi:hypothetical protein